MTLKYEVSKDEKNSRQSISTIRNMCKLLERKETSGDMKILDDKYLCPCGILNMRLEVDTQHGETAARYPKIIQISSEKCGI